MDDRSPEFVLIEPLFEADQYLWEYPDVAFSDLSALSHFLTIGWKEGRNPNAFFDTAGYLLKNADVADAAINPYYHYLRFGMDEGREATAAAAPSVRSHLLFGYEVIDWVDLIAPRFDAEYYRGQCAGLPIDDVNLVAHFAYYGWRRGLSPSRGFSVRNWVARNPALPRFLVNPVIVQGEKDQSRFDDTAIRRAHLIETAKTRAKTVVDANMIAPPDACEREPSALSEDDIALLRTNFSEAYYLATYDDLAGSTIAAFDHFLHQGCDEERNPNADFDTGYYLKSNPDVVAAGLHPYLHYLTVGRAEGRPGRAPGGWRRAVIEAAVPPEARSRDYVDIATDPVLSTRQIVATLLRHASDCAGLAVACSHDCYVRSVGGTQIFIADEAAAFRQRGYLYLQISPRSALLHMAANDATGFEVRLVCNDDVIGVATLPALTAALRQMRRHFATAQLFVVHSALGFSVAALREIRLALLNPASFLWLHDYSTACLGYNLLRNNVTYCGAPAADSMACRVCVYGASRATHLVAMRELFEDGVFSVVAPSEVALKTWQSATDLPAAAAVVHPHWQLTTSGKRRRARKPGPVRIAFLGHAADAKGWPIFTDLVRRLHSDARFQFLHFIGGGQSPLAEVTAIATTVTQADRTAAMRLLAEHEIDFVAMLSNWPETFSYVACEVVVAGAFLLAFASSGNVRAIIETTGCGRVFDDANALVGFLETGGAAAFLQTQRRVLPRYDYENAGTTATLVAPARLSKPTALAAE